MPNFYHRMLGATNLLFYPFDTFGIPSGLSVLLLHSGGGLQLHLGGFLLLHP